MSARPACALCGRSDITLRQTGPDTWVCADDHLGQWRPADHDLVLDERYASPNPEEHR